MIGKKFEYFENCGHFVKCGYFGRKCRSASVPTLEKVDILTKSGHIVNCGHLMKCGYFEKCGYFDKKWIFWEKVVFVMVKERVMWWNCLSVGNSLCPHSMRFLFLDLSVEKMNSKNKKKIIFGSTYRWIIGCSRGFSTYCIWLLRLQLLSNA